MHGKSKYVLAAALSICFVMAAERNAGASVISGVYISARDQYEAGVMMEPEIQVNAGGGAELLDISWKREVENWLPGHEVQAVLTIGADNEDAQFSGDYGKGSCKVTGAELVSAKRGSDSQTLMVTIKYVPVVQLGGTEQAGWGDASKTLAVWNSVRYANAYQVRLYEGDQVIKSLKVETNSADFTQYMTKNVPYYFDVRACAKDTERNYIKDGEYVESSDVVIPQLGDTEGRFQDDREGRRYLQADGTYAMDGWRQIVGKWYYFNQDGYALTGWFPVDQKWYYADGMGEMATGWQLIDGVWYYFMNSGEMAVGWCQVLPGKWYYLNQDGSMAANTMIGPYRVDENGLWDGR